MRRAAFVCQAGHARSAYRARRKPSTRWTMSAVASASYDGSELSAK